MAYMTSTNKLNILKNGKNSKIEIESYYEIIFNDVILIALFPDHLSHRHPAINLNPSALDVINKWPFSGHVFLKCSTPEETHFQSTHCAYNNGCVSLSLSQTIPIQFQAQAQRHLINYLCVHPNTVKYMLTL